MIYASPSGDSPDGAWRRFYGFEPFVDADLAAEFLCCERKTVLDWARAASIPAHPFGRGHRTEWRFRLSELASCKEPVREIMKGGSPEITRPEHRNG